MLDPLEFNWVILKRHGVVVFEQRAHEFVDARVTLELDQKLAALRRLSDFAVLDNDFSPFDHVSRMAEHALHVVVVFVNHDIRVTTDAQVALLRKAKSSRGTGRHRNRDFVQRVLAIDFRQRDLALHLVR